MTTTLNRLTETAERRIRRAATGFVIFVALAAAVLSFSGLHHLALTAGFHPYIAPLFPLATDVAVAAFSLAVLHHSLTGLKVWYPWMCMLLGVAVSVAGNVWSAPEDLVSRLVHAWPPIVFALSFEALTRLIRHRIDHAAPEPDVHSLVIDAVVEAPAAEPARDETPPVQEVTSPSEPAPLSSPAVPAATEPQAAVERPSEPAGPAVPAAEAITPAEDAPQPDAAPAVQTSPEEPAAKHISPPAKASRPAVSRPKAGTLRERVIDTITANPELTQAEVARQLDADPSNVSKIYRRLRNERTDLFAPSEPQRVTAAEPASTTETAPVFLPVMDAKAEVLEAANGSKERAMSVWNEAGLPHESNLTVSRRELDNAIRALNEHANTAGEAVRG